MFEGKNFSQTETNFCSATVYRVVKQRSDKFICFLLLYFEKCYTCRGIANVNYTQVMEINIIDVFALFRNCNDAKTNTVNAS